ncbi:FRG domain-containing protein [Comamonas thiooxydans]|uniref:FRG domain-containing protein n=1 Tax=Comamonas thiooxydans TaxID=363952 RepID=UPI002114C5D4|nr:FRG domain-containing protein [Comamonas thiooxydans]UUE96204.1 FRG domain-containing protein [Comamonas thiooxydans]
MSEIIIESWSHFVDQASRWESSFRGETSITDHSKPPVLFRGHASDKWKIQTTLERTHKDCISVLDYHKRVYETKHQLESLSNSKWEVPKPDAFQNHLRKSEWYKGIPALNYLVYLRHHGFPSPLLDWTRSPFIAAFFAFQKVDPSTENVAIYSFIPLERSMSSPVNSDLRIQSLGHRVRTHKRHVLQQAEYTICINKRAHQWEYASYEEFFETCERPPYKFIIPSQLRRDFLKNLDLFNLNEYTIYGSDDGLVQSTAMRVFDYY